MLSKHFLYFLFISTYLALNAMEGSLSDQKRCNQNAGDDIENIDQTNDQAKSYFELLPEEMVEKIRLNFVKAGENFEKSIQNYQKFNEVLSKTRGIDYTIKNFNEDHVILFSGWLKINPFFVSRRLKVKLSDKLKEQFKKQAIKDEARNHKIPYEELKNWFEGLKNYWLRTTKSELDIKDERQAEHVFSIQMKKNSIKGILALLNAGIDPDLEDKYLHKVLFFKAIKNGNAEVVSVLLNCGADPDGDRLGLPWQRTALMEAVAYNNRDIVILLLKAGANPNLKDHSGNTPLIYSVKKDDGSKNLVKVLLEAGADPNIIVMSGSSINNALLEAEEKNDQELISLLKFYGATKPSWSERISYPFIWVLDKEVDYYFFRRIYES